MSSKIVADTATGNGSTGQGSAPHPQGKLARRLEHFASFAPGVAALVFTIVALMLPMLHARAAEADAAAAAQRQLVTLGTAPAYQFAVYANNSLQQPLAVTRAVVLVHGIKRNADDYFVVGQHLIKNAGFTPADTLLLAPNFMTGSDAGVSDNMPLWTGASWNQGEASEGGVSGIVSFQPLDDLIRYLADRQRFPQLREIVMMGHSAGAQLMQRYAALSDIDTVLAPTGIKLRFIISSPSSYVYFDPSRPTADGFAPPASVMCPGYDNYRYGIDNPPDYLARQHLTGQQLFARYAARDITYMVGAHDDNPNHRFLDRACGARMQGNTRVERQLNFARYERFLSAKWNIAVNHPEFQVPGAAHEAERLYRTPETARKLFPQ